MFTVQVLVAQKDTIRENIDYRMYYRTSGQHEELQNRLLKKGRKEYGNMGVQSKDTLREEIDYRKNYSFYHSYKYRPTPPVSFYFAIQANSIFHEISKPDSSYTANPYALTFTINQKRKGFGLGIGYGFTEWGHKTEDALLNEIESGHSRMNFRIGLDKKISIGKRLWAGVGIDGVHFKYKDIQKTFISGLVDETSTKTTGWGFGPRALVLFKIYKWVYIGTEASYYFKQSKTKSITRFTGLPPETQSESRSTTTSFLEPFTVFIAAKLN